MPKLEITQGIGPTAVVGELALISGQITQSLDGNDRLICRVEWPPRRGSAGYRTPIRLTEDDGRVTDWRIADPKPDARGNSWADIEAMPPIQDLADAGIMRQIVGGAISTRFAGTYALTTWLREFGLSKLGAPISTWLSATLGTIDVDPDITLDFEQWTYLEFFRACAQASRQELALERQTNGIHKLAMYQQRGSTAPVTRVDYGRNLLTKDPQIDFEGMASVIVPFGDSVSEEVGPATIAENAWVATSIDTNGWVTLRGVGGSTGPVRFDHQFVAHGAGWFDGTGMVRTTILDSRVSDGAVRLQSPTGLVTGAMVTLYADATGTPLLELQNPELMATDVGRVERRISISGGRGERNYIVNSQMAENTAGWQMGQHGALIARPKLPISLTPLAKGARAADTPTTTPFPIDGLTAGEPVYEGDAIEVAGATLTVDTDAIPGTDGSLTLHMDVGLPGDLADGASLTIVRKRRRTFTVDGTQNVMSRGILVASGGTVDGFLLEHPAQSRPYQQDTNGRGARLSVSTLQGVGWNNTAWYAFPAASGKIRFATYQKTYPNALFFPGAAGGTYQSIVAMGFTYDSGSGRWNMVVGPGQAAILSAMITGTTTCQIDGYAFVLYSTNSVGDAGGTITWEFITTSLLPGESAPDGSSSLTLWQSSIVWSNVTIANATALYVDEVREVRTLQLQGAHAAGSQTLTFRPSADLARRDFTTSDTVSVPRSTSFTMRVTGIAVSSHTEYDDQGAEIRYWDNTLTLDLANSTIDEEPTGNWHYREVAIAPPGGGTQRVIMLTPLSGNVMIVSTPYSDGPLTDVISTTPMTLTITLSAVDTYAVTGAASWGSNGRATVPISIPSGRSYAAGELVWTNFHPVSPYGQNYGARWTCMRVATAVTGPASSLVIEGTDQLHYVGNYGVGNLANPANNALWRIKGGSASAQQSSMDLAGAVLYAAATAIADGTGTANVTLRTPNAIAIADNQPLLIRRVTMHGVGEAANGSAVRLLGNAWRSGANPWTLLPNCYVEFPPGTTARQVTVSVWFVSNFDNGNQPLESPLTVGVLAANGAVLGQASIAQIYGTGIPQLHRITTRVTVTAAGIYRIGVQGGLFGVQTLFVATRAMLWVGGGVENVPFVGDAHANAMLLRAQDELVARAEADSTIRTTLARFVGITGVVPTASALIPGASYYFAESDETFRMMNCTRALFSADVLSMTFARLDRTIGRYLGTGSSSSGGSGSASVVSGGTSVVSPMGLTVTDAQGNSVADVRALSLDGLAVTANGQNRATLSVVQGADVTSPNCVIDGGDWVPRDLVVPSYQITVTAGSGSIDGKTVKWPQTTVTCPAANGHVYVDAAGIVRARPAGNPEQVPAQHNELLLWRTFVDVSGAGPRVYALIESRTWGRMTPRAPLFLAQRIEEMKVTSGAWAGATAISANGNIIWAFGNTTLMPFVETHAQQVKDHLDIQIAKFYATATGTGSADWTTLHGTTWSAYYHWPYDVGDPRGTPVKLRADSHDAYAASFVRLAVRYALVHNDMAWWDANVASIQNALYWNLVARQRLVGGGYLNETFQDPSIYPFCQTMDNFEVYAALRDAGALMTARGGAQATWASTYATGTAAQVLAGLADMWSDSPNDHGETGWLSPYFDTTNSVKVKNNLRTMYPELSCALVAPLYDIPLHSTPSIARARIQKAFDWINAKAPGWFYSRRYNLFPFGFPAVAAVKMGFRELGEAWLSYVQRHHAVDSIGYLTGEDIGYARWIERLLEGDTL